MKMILFVLHDANKLKELLDAWQAAGVTGTTVFFSTGTGRIRRGESLRDDLPLMPSLSDFFDRDRGMSRTLFTVVRDQATVKRVLAATRSVVGDLDRPDTGLLVVLPVEQVAGLVKKHT